MTKLLLLIFVVVSQLTLVSCTRQGVALVPLTETERQGLGTIGIAAEMSRPEALYSRDASIIDSGLRKIEDRVDAFGQGALEGVKQVKGFKGAKDINCKNTACLLLLAVIPAEALVRGIAGGVVGAIDGKTYSSPPLMELPDGAVIRTVQESIDAVGLPDRLRDHVWEKARMYKAYQFERLSELPADPLKMQGEDRNREKGAGYWPLRDKGIHTLLKIRIPLIEFRGPDPEDVFQLGVHVETTLQSTIDQSCIRHRTWEYQGGSHLIAEWSKDGATLLVDELDRGLPLIAQQVIATFFRQPALFSLEAPTAVIPKSESLDCLG
jgi:hypothetical protein